MCLSHLIYTVRACLIHTCHAIPILCSDHAVVAAHYKKDDLLHCWTSSSDISGYHADLHEGQALSEQGRGAAWHVWINARHSMGTACYVWIGLYKRDTQMICSVVWLSIQRNTNIPCNTSRTLYLQQMNNIAKQVQTLSDLKHFQVTQISGICNS